LPPQHGQQQLAAVLVASLSATSTIWVCSASALCFIGHESPLQQSQVSQHEAVSLPDESFVFIGHESWPVELCASSFIFIGHESAPFGQHDIAVLVAAVALL